MESYNLCIIKPNKTAFSETFIQQHINRLEGNKKVLYGGAFPVYDDKGKFLIRSRIGLLNYLIQKRFLKRKDIKVRTKALVNYFKRERIDVVLAEYGMVGAMVSNACEIAKVPLIIHFHGADVHERQTVAEYLDFYKRAFTYSSGIIAVSLDMVEELVRLGANRNKVHFIPCGVDTEQFSPIMLNTAENNFFSIGRFVDKKAPLSVIQAFRKLLQEVPNAHLWMVGDGPLFTSAGKLILDLNLSGRVHLLGVQSQEDIYKLMPSMRCFVQHSVTAKNGDKEGTPVTILEAGAVGLPIVSTSHAGIKQAVLDGVSGFLVDENDIDGMARRMVQIAQAAPEILIAMGEAGRAHILSNYNVVTQVAKLNAVIRNSITK